MSSTSQADILKGFDMALLALGILPEAFSAATALYHKLKSGDEVTDEELDTLLAKIKSRNERIQAA